MKRLLLHIMFLVMLSYSGTAQTVHFMMFAATNDYKLGTSSRAAKTYFETTFATLIRQCGFSLDAQYYTDSKFTKEQLETALSNLRSNSNDVIIFYFTGHGFNDCRSNCPNPNDYPTILLGISGTPKPPRMKSELDIFNTLRNKPHRLLLTIAEACNREEGAFKSGGGGIKPHSEYEVDLGKFRRLFLTSGDYIVSSSIKGEYSYSDDIGFFTHSFITVLAQKTSKSCNYDLTWNSILDAISTFTTEYSRDKKDEEGKICIQHPQWKKYGVVTPTPPVPNKVLSSSVERKLSKMFESPKDRSEGMCLKGKYFNLETSPSGLVLAKCSNNNIPSKFFFGHMGRDDFYPAIQTMIITDTDDFLVIDLNNSDNYRQYDNIGNLSSNTTSSKKNYRYSCIEYANGDIYSGETVNGKYDGFGVYVWANGNSWYGQWSNGIRLGYGIFCPYDGSRQVIIGYWNNHEYSSQ